MIETSEQTPRSTSRTDKFKRLDPSSFWLTLAHQPTLIVTTRGRGRINHMAAAWNMLVDRHPCKVAAVISDCFTRRLLDASAEVTLNIPSAVISDKVYLAGTRSGADCPKHDLFALRVIDDPAGALIVTEGSVAALHVRPVPEPALASKYEMVIFDVRVGYADSELFGEDGFNFTDNHLSTFHHVSRGKAHLTGRKFCLHDQ